MSDVAIRIQDLGKRYRLKHEFSKARYRTLREDLLGWPRSLWRGLLDRRSEREDFWALRDVSFEVKRGEVLGVIGRNGAGKSTLLKILSRIVEPTKGIVDIYGRVGSLLEVGTGFHPELTGRENIFLSGALLGMRRHEVRAHFDEIVAFAEVEKFLDTPCKHYSSGMYTRLGFAVAAHLGAEILLVDEVLAVGDAGFQRRCLAKMAEIAGSGRTVLFVSHNLGAVSQMCSRAVILEQGSCTYQGNAIAAVERYLDRGMKSDFPNRYVELDRADQVPSDRIHSVTVRNSVTKSPVLLSEPIEIEVEFSVRDPASDVALLLGIYDLNGNRIMFLDSSAIPNLDLRSGTSNITLLISLSNDFALKPGDYALNAALRISDRLVHHVPDACRLEVLPSDFFGNGRIPDSPILVAQSWSVHRPLNR